MLPTDNKALLGVLNSKLVWTFLTNICVVRNGGYIEVKPQYFEKIPVPSLEGELSEALNTIVGSMLLLNEQLQTKRNRFLHRLSDNFQDIKITGALSTFDQLEFAEFLKELKKQKIKISLSEQDDWEIYFDNYRTACQELSAQIATANNEIDLRVYKLYGLTYDEVLIVDSETAISREEYEMK